MEYSIKPKRLGERGIIHYPQKRIIGLYVELSRRAEKAAQQKGLEVGTKEYYEYCTKYVDPRNIPPSVIEDAISSSKAIPGNRPDTFIHETLDVKVVINSNGKVITVIPK